jgi:hypothetical protein
VLTRPISALYRDSRTKQIDGRRPVVDDFTDFTNSHQIETPIA